MGGRLCHGANKPGWVIKAVEFADNLTEAENFNFVRHILSIPDVVVGLILKFNNWR
jgi:hypothetical protein